VRHKLYDLHQAMDSPIAAQGLRRIGELYAIGNEICGRPADERRSARQARAGPLLDDLRSWCQASLPKISGKSELAVAIRMRSRDGQR
jgi:transposase